ncbi:SUMF1/EgtB/PvdO family nonheme iron enzyme [uncultured Roseobacter sp.]|uniref:formylglycine-generating enzyme family protein n=1 Tax=uncultured Roseobacter sp. TaxID=114847 RepID=UPI002628D6D1|nr:SUMF1/EgtB/PvdO family nonheme iron enzyme [uncultured Roseobacter sp.]
MIAISGGKYRIGRDEGPISQRPLHRVDLAGFRVDREEVTNAAFVEFLNALSLSPERDFPSGGATKASLGDTYPYLAEDWEGSGNYPIVALDDDQSRIAYENGQFTPEAGYSNHPVTETTWAGARAYCEWRGARLPTEAEWEAVARGETDRNFPWGNKPPNEGLAHIDGLNGQTRPVGSYPDGATPDGVLDLSGSLAEWTSTLRRPFPYDPNDGREDLLADGERVTRGGDYRYDNGPNTLTASHRVGFSNAPGRGHRHIGFRCVTEIDAMGG